MRAAAAAVAVATWVPATAVAEAAVAGVPTGVGRVPPLAAAGYPNGGGGRIASGPSLGFQMSHASAPTPLDGVSRDSSPSRAGTRDRDKVGWHFYL